MNWDNFEKIVFHGIYNELRVAPEERMLIYALRPKAPEDEKSKIVTILFESFNVASTVLISQAAASLYNVGINTGLAVICGESGTFVCPVYEGYELSHMVQSNDIGGNYITNILKQMLDKKMQSVPKSEVEKYKKEHCFVSNSIQNDISNPGAHNVEVTASDGTIVNLNRERFLPPEVIFNPSLVNNPSQGIAQLIKNCIDKCDPDLKKMLQTNVVLSGGCTSLPGFEVRLHNELQYQYSIISDTDRTHGVIKGEKKIL